MQLNKLVGRLLDSHSFYVKCIKPNAEKNPNKFDSKFVMSQMQASGLLESIKINTSGYEFRESIESFVDKFWPIGIKKTYDNGESVDEAMIRTFSFSGKEESDVMPGSLETYVQKIFTIASNGDIESPVHPIHKQWALGLT